MAAPDNENYVPTDDELEAVGYYDRAMMLAFLRGYLAESEDFQRGLARAWASYQRGQGYLAQLRAGRDQA